MRKALKVAMVFLMILGITLSILNFISVDMDCSHSNNESAERRVTGTQQPDGCYGAPLNCSDGGAPNPSG